MSTGESGFLFDTLPEINTYSVRGTVTDNINFLYKGNTRENTVIEDVEDNVDELPDSDFSKSATRVFEEIDNGKGGFFS